MGEHHTNPMARKFTEAPTPPTPLKDRVTFYKDDKGEWRWKRQAPNNEVVGASTEGYQKFKDCWNNLGRQGTDADWEVEG